MKTKPYFRNAVLMFFLLGFAQILFAQNTKEYSLKGFDKLEMSSAFVIDVKHGSSYKVSVDAERSEDIDDLEVKISGGTLIAKYRDAKTWNWRNNRKRVTFTIVMPTLRQVEFSGATKSKISGFDDLEDVTLKFSGAANAEININADKVNLDCSGASRVKLNGKTSKFNFDVSGASNVDSFNLTARDVDAELSGASSVKISAVKTLNVEASGASSLRYRGQPSVRSDVSGASSVRSAD